MKSLVRRLRILRFLLFEEGGRRSPSDVLRKSVYLWRRGRWSRSLRRRTRRPDSVPLDRPIFLLGLENGGLTIIARTLVRNPAVVTTMGNSSFWTGLDEIGSQPSRMRALPPQLWGPKHRADIAHPRLGDYHSCIYASDELLPFYRHTPEEATPELAERFKRVIREHILIYAHEPMRARFLDKTQTYTVSAGFVNALLTGHRPHFVLVLRNPYTMVYAQVNRRMRMPAISSLPYEERLRIAAAHWENSFRLALEDAEHIEHFLVVRFEDFVADPEAFVRRLCDFAGLQFDPHMVPQPHHRLPFGTWPGEDKWYPVRPDPYLEKVGDLEAEIVERRCGKLAERFGYSRSGAAELTVALRGSESSVVVG